MFCTGPTGTALIRPSRVIQRLKVADVVEVTGALPRPALAARMRAADVCVAPLRRDVRNQKQGCSPIKLFEYMAAGRGVLTTDLACTREIVDESRGVLIASPRPKLLSERLLAMLEDTAGTQALGEAGRAVVAANRGALARTRAKIAALLNDS